MAGIVVTGGRGRLGKALCRFYRNRRQAVKGLGRGELELSDTEEVVSTIARLRPKIILHTAAKTGVDDCERNPDEAFRDNVEATRNLSLAANKVGAF
jgi:dTDP-4-dehydrorhamnose reductase